MSEGTASAAPPSLAGFLAARLDEDEAVAREAASLSPWRVSDVNDDGTRDVEPADAPDGLWHGEVANHIAGSDARHIARHDPARVLREVAAKRAILAEAQAVQELLKLTSRNPELYRDWVLRHLAAVYSDHPDYRAEWKP